MQATVEASALIVNPSFNELNQLAAHFASAGLLSKYVRPYVERKNSIWKKVLPETIYKSTFARRTMPRGLKESHIIQAARLSDFLLAAAQRIPRGLPTQRYISDRLTFYRDAQLAKTAAKSFKGERIMIASWGAAVELFEHVGNDCLKILNYSFAHHRSAKKILEGEVGRNPEFAHTLNSHDWPVSREMRLDREIELADYILVGSEFVRQTFIQQGIRPAKIWISEYGVDLDRFSPCRRTEKIQPLNALFVGQIGQRKGLSYLLTAFKDIPSSMVRLTLVGKMQGSKSAFSSYSEVCRHIPHTTQGELAQIYRSSDFFVFPSIVEGMSLAVLEAMAAGLPVITTFNAGSVVRDGVDGFIVPVGDSAAIRERVELFSKDRSLIRWMGQNARQRAEQFSWPAYANRTTDLIISAMESR